MQCCGGSGLVGVSSTSPSPCWEGAGWLRGPCPTGMGAALVRREREKACKPSLLVLGNCAKQSSCLFIFFLPCPSSFSLMDLRFVSLGKEVPAGVRCQRGTFVYLSRCGGCSPPGPRVLRARGWVPTTLSLGAGALMPSALCYRGSLLTVCAGNSQLPNDGQATSLR